MIVDASALIAVLRGEEDAPRFARALASRAEPKRLSAANSLAAAIVIDGSRDPIASRRLDELIAKAGIEIEPVTAEQAEIARAAYRDFGKGGRPAGLNFGDCFAYALAKATGEPLLFKGDDFARTDLRAWREA
jgi:ribonuclease VapC